MGLKTPCGFESHPGHSAQLRSDTLLAPKEREGPNPSSPTSRRADRSSINCGPSGAACDGRATSYRDRFPIAGADRRGYPRSMGTRVLVVDDDDDVRDLIVAALTDAGYDCAAAADGHQALVLARAEPFDLFVLDIKMPLVSGDDVHRELRRDPRTRFVPVVFVTGQRSSRDIAVRLLRGADDYVTKPFDMDELVARVGAVLRRGAELRALNPLSGLPGNVAITAELERHLEADDAYACMYCDLDHFKAFNDHHGFARGDALITRLADLLLGIARSAHDDTFVGHVGGDDFVVIVPEAEAEDLARTIVRDFDALAPTMYDEADRARGCVLAIDRQGMERRMPFVTISIGIVPISVRRASDPVALSRAASEVKEIAKRRDGSSWAVDRRGATAHAEATGSFS